MVFGKIWDRTMRTEELISIVIPSCGDGIWLKRTVDSIRAMTTWSNYEIITVLNYSSENSRYNDVEFLRQPIYKDIIVIESNHPLGVSGARNIGASIAKGFFICFMDGHCLVLNFQIGCGQFWNTFTVTRNCA